MALCRKFHIPMPLLYTSYLDVWQNCSINSTMNRKKRVQSQSLILAFAPMDHAQELFTKQLIGVIATSTEFLELFKNSINRLNVYPVPDGDTGSNLSLTFQSMLNEIDALDPESMDIGSCVQAISKGALMGARGNSGVIFSQIVRGFAEGVKRASDSGESFIRGVAWGLDLGSELADKAVLKPVEGTILTVARRAAGATETGSSEESPLGWVHQVRKIAVEASRHEV